LRDMVFDKRGIEQNVGKAHLFTLTDFLDDSWPHRSYWIFGTQCSLATGCSGRDKNLIFGRLLVFNESKIYGYGRSQVHWSNQLQDGPYRLFCVGRDEGTALWQKPLPIQVWAMVLTDKALFVAGPALDVEGESGKKKAMLMAISASDGAELTKYPLDSPPIFDGMAAAYGRLYVSMTDGSLICMAQE